MLAKSEKKLEFICKCINSIWHIFWNFVKNDNYSDHESSIFLNLVSLFNLLNNLAVYSCFYLRDMVCIDKEEII